jgi:hypothetical protein
MHWVRLGHWGRLRLWGRRFSAATVLLCSCLLWRHNHHNRQWDCCYPLPNQAMVSTWGVVQV